MSGDQHNQADPLDLDEVEDLCAIVRDEENRTWHERQDALWQLLDTDGTVPALVAEVRRLRDTLAVVARHRCCRDCGATFEQCQRYRLGRAIKCCPDCHHAA